MKIDKEMTKVDVEDVIRKQDTHDLYCPNCDSCITKTVILRKKKPESSEHDDEEEESTNVEYLNEIEDEVTEIDVEEVIEKHDEANKNNFSLIPAYSRPPISPRAWRLDQGQHRFAKLKSREVEDFIPSKLPLNGELSRAIQIDLKNEGVMELPESPNCPKLTSLSLQKNPDLRSIPASFFQSMRNLKEVDLSGTGIKSLPRSFFHLVALQKLFMRNCQVFVELPAKIGQLHNLEVLDLEGTDIIQLPAEIGDLVNLTCLKVSFCQWCCELGEITIVPEGTLSKLARLVELSIDVDPEDSRWEEAAKVVIKELVHLKKLEYLKMYIPQVELLDELAVWLGQPATRFNLNVGGHMRRVMSRTPLGAEGISQHGRKHLGYVNGKGSIPSQVKNLLKYSDGLFLDRHFTVGNLSEFGTHNMENLRYCMLGECNELQTIVQDDDSDKNPVFPELEQLIIYNMKTLTSIYRAPLKKNSLCRLKTLKLHGCAQLRTIFILGSDVFYLDNLEEIIVEDCPAVVSLITCNNSHGRIGWSFRNLKKISLHYLTELQSLFSGIYSAPRLESLSVYDCPNLKTLSAREISGANRLKVIRGEEEWWKALQWNEPEWKLQKLASVFVPIRSDADLETQLAQDPIPQPGTDVENEIQNQYSIWSPFFLGGRPRSHPTIPSAPLLHPSYSMTTRAKPDLFAPPATHLKKQKQKHLGDESFPFRSTLNALHSFYRSVFGKNTGACVISKVVEDDEGLSDVE